MSLRCWGALAFIFGAVAGCQTTRSTPPPLEDGTETPPTAGTCVDQDGDGYGPFCAKGVDCDDTNAAVTTQCYATCAHDGESGCTCATEGARANCGQVTAQFAGGTTCGYGESVCSGGKWGACLLDGRTVRSFRSSEKPLGLAAAAPCAGNVCDPYCQQFPDTPDNSLSAPGLLATDGGLTLEGVDAGTPPLLPNGPMPASIKAALQDAGLTADAAPDAIIYHELPPPTTAQDIVAATTPSGTSAGTIDVYFLETGTSLASGATASLRTAVTSTPNGVIDRVRLATPDSWFGVGQYQNYDQWPYKATTAGTDAYNHVRSMTADRNQVDAALGWVNGQLIDTSIAPQSWMAALFATATTGGLPRAAPGTYWVPPRSAWSADSGAESGPCPAGRIGYPCFRPNALPITVLLANVPSNNGPGGQYAYSRGNYLTLNGATSWSTVTPHNVTNNYDEQHAYPLVPSGFGIYVGNTSGALANQSWQWGNSDDCQTGWFSDAKNAFFTFSVLQRTWFHFDTVESTFVKASGATDYGTALYLYKMGGAGVACNIQHFDGEQGASSLDGVVDPGVYFLVVDGAYGSYGQYSLHVNAMPDGLVNGPITEPNYDEALTAYSAIGGKIVGIDSSGYNCDGGSGKWLQRNTSSALEKLALDTASVDALGTPHIVHMTQSGAPCHVGDAPLAQQIADAITGFSSSRSTITAIAVDTDDSVDFDGPPIGPNTLTPVNIDDATFVQSIVTLPTEQTNANCQQTLPDRFVGCLPGTTASFTVNLKTPSTVAPASHPQIFTFVIRTLADGARTLSETPFVVVVPGWLPPSHQAAWFVRDYDTTNVCPKGTSPLWGLWGWTALTPGDSQIDFDVTVADSLADLDTSAHDPLLFSLSPGPSSLVKKAIGVVSTPQSTQLGAALVDDTLAGNMRARDSKFLRMRAHLLPSSDQSLAPTLQTWNMQISCRPAE